MSDSPRDAFREVLEAVNRLQARLEDALKNGKTIEQSIARLDANVEPITRAATAVNEVARQTLMVSVNASIEAARVGEQGAAFGVVADEIGTLARRVQATSDEMSTLTERNRESTNEIHATFDRFIAELDHLRDNQDVEQAFSRAMREIDTVSPGRATSTPGSRPSVAPAPMTLSNQIEFDNATMGTGIASIDGQHRRLIEALNQLEVMVREERNLDDVRGLLDFLGTYVVEHFSHEEQLMDEKACPVSAINKKQHARFLAKYKDWRDEFDRTGGSLAMVEELHGYLAKWLKHHICKTDRCMRGEKRSDQLAPSAVTMAA